MDRDDVMAVLGDAGFSGYEATVYTTVLHRGDAPVADLPDLCDVPRTRAYDVVRDLEGRGLVETYEDATRRVRPLDPGPLLERLDSRATGIRETADEIETMWRQSGVRQSSITVVQDYDQVLRKAAAEFGEAENLISVSLRPSDVDVLSPSLRSAIDEDVTVRISLLDTPQTEPIDYGDEFFAEVATEVRRCESLVPFMALLDGPNGIFAIRDSFGHEYGILVRDHFLTSILHWFYQMQLWEPWNVLYSAVSETPDQYVSVHELIRDFRSTPVDENTITVRIEGYDTMTGDAVDVTGRIVDVVQADHTESSIDVPFIQATLLVDTGDETVTVGGYGAIIEDIRSYSVEILSVS